jgi:hypothetical protein
LENVELLKVIDIDSNYSFVNKKSYFIKGFGLLQTIKMGLKVVSAKVLNLIDTVTSYKLAIKPKKA